MAMTESLAGRWIRRYKLFFLLGFFILIFQLILAYLLPIFSSTDDVILRSSSAQHNINTLQQNHINLGDDEDHSNSIVYTKPKINKELASNSNTNNNKNVKLRLNELQFTPICDQLTKEAISAVHRAQTQECKQIIINTTCAIHAGTFYAASLPNFCPNQSFIANRALGCFKDEKKFRILSGYYTNFKTLNTPTKCIQMCLQSGFLYAGVQYSTECFCGNTEPPATAKLPDPECNYKCIGDPKQICGGYFTVNVYETGISKFIPQQAELVPKYGEENVKIVFLLTLNGRALRQVHRLLKALYSKNHFFYIHVDARQDYMFRELLKLETSADNIRLARKRFSTIWGGASLLKMLLKSMVELQTLDWNWDFVINLSESDFLIKTVDKLVEFLSANKDRNFVKSHGREVQRFIQKQGLDKTFVECDTHMWRIGDRHLPGGIQIDGGSDWIALSRDFVKYVTDENQDDLIKGLLTIFHHTLLPAESFFHTALRNSQFCNSYVDNNLHMTNWKRRLGCKCQYKHVVDWCGCSPNDFRPDDWARLLATELKQLFFARKFEPIINQGIIFKLEEWLFGPYPTDFPNLHSYWQSVYHSADASPNADETLLTIVNSLARIKADSNPVSYDVVEISEVNTFMENDFYRGFLVRYRVATDQEDLIELELLARPMQLSQASRNSNIGKRIKQLEVSTDYDQKEQMIRNFAKTIGPFSDLFVVLHVISAEGETMTNFNLTALWINPAGMLVDATNIHVETSGAVSIHFGKSSAKQPHLPGVWTVKLVHKRSVIAQCRFLICPFQENANQIQRYESMDQDAIIDGLKNWSSFLAPPLERETLKQKALANTKRVGLDLSQWIDSLVKQFYSIRDSCIVYAADGADEQNNFKQMPLCKETTWSSLSPDPKSDIYSDIQSL